MSKYIQYTASDFSPNIKSNVYYFPTLRDYFLLFATRRPRFNS